MIIQDVHLIQQTPENGVGKTSTRPADTPCELHGALAYLGAAKDGDVVRLFGDYTFLVRVMRRWRVSVEVDAICGEDAINSVVGHHESRYWSQQAMKFEAMLVGALEK